MKHRACGKEMSTISGHQFLQISAFLRNGNRYHETNFDESDLGEEVYYCGECGRPLTEDEAVEFVKLTG